MVELFAMVECNFGAPHTGAKEQAFRRKETLSIESGKQSPPHQLKIQIDRGLCESFRIHHVAQIHLTTSELRIRMRLAWHRRCGLVLGAMCAI